MTRLPRRRVREPMMPERATQREFPRHRKFIRSLECVCANISTLIRDAPGYWQNVWCGGRIECCHLRLGSHAPMSEKPHDWFCFPACAMHHQQAHRVGELTFQTAYGLDLRAIALGLARQSPDQDMRRIMRERGIL